MALEHSAFAKKFYNSKAWKRCREGYINSLNNGGMCEHCEKKGKLVHGYILDHIEEININNIDNPDITLNWDNLQYLCLSCHNKKTFKKSEPTIPDGFYFNSEGRLVPLDF